MLQNPQTHTLCIRIAQDTIRQHDSHLATGFQEVVASFYKKHFWSFAVQFITCSNLLIYFYFCAKWWVRKYHIELSMRIVFRSAKMEVMISTMLDAFVYSFGNVRNVWFATIRIVERVDVIDIRMSVTSHHHIHTCSLLQVWVKVETENHLLGILTHSVVHFCGVELGFKMNVVEFRIEILCNLMTHMVEYHHKETARTTSWVEYTTILVGIKHLNHTFDNITWCKELASLLLQRVAHNGFVGSTLHVNRSIQERILCQFACYESKATVRKHNLFITVEHILEDIAILQILENTFDALSYFMLPFWRVLFFYSHPKTTTVADTFSCIREATFLIIELAEDKVEKFPKGSLLHTLVTIDIIMTTLEGFNKRLISWFAWYSSLALCFKVFKGLTLCRKIRNSLTSYLAKSVFESMYIL